LRGPGRSVNMVAMFETALFLLFATLVFLWAKRLLRKRREKKGRGAKAARTGVEAWAEEMVAAEVARKMGSERAGLLETLRGNPDPDTVGAVEQAVRSVQVAYEKMAGGQTEAEVRVEVSFEDGTNQVARKRIGWDELPQTVRDDFARTQGAVVFRPFVFPWNE
jgi:uncharacterized protein YhaN